MNRPGSGRASQPELEKEKNILICPLEWGLGHAARMIPLARKLVESGNNVFIGSGHKHLALFRSEVEGLRYIDFPGFSPRYSSIFPQYFIMLLKTPLLLWHIIAEHRKLKKIIAENEIDIIISDNRFGLWNNKITSVYFTHMPLIPLPRPWKAFEKTGAMLHRFIMKKYTYCCIPDLDGDINLSGKLSHGMKLPDNVRYTGILSRFSTNYDNKHKIFGYPHNSVILSGPEPQRGILRKKLIQHFRNTSPATVILEGKPGTENEVIKEENLIFHNHLTAPDMKELLITSENIISRAGYTTIMDLVFLNSSALLIPTPGQTEQEYLAEYLSGKGWFATTNQREMNLSFPAREKEDIPFELLKEKSEKLLDSFLGELLQDLD